VDHNNRQTAGIGRDLKLGVELFDAVGLPRALEGNEELVGIERAGGLDRAAANEEAALPGDYERFSAACDWRFFCHR
jgi:hypothetical protein